MVSNGCLGLTWLLTQVKLEANKAESCLLGFAPDIEFSVRFLLVGTPKAPLRSEPPPPWVFSNPLVSCCSLARLVADLWLDLRLWVCTEGDSTPRHPPPGWTEMLLIALVGWLGGVG